MRYLAGRKHDRLMAYATGGSSNYPLEKLSRKIDHYLGLGFRAFKIGAGSHSVEDGFHIENTLEVAASFEKTKLEHIGAHVPERIWDLFVQNVKRYLEKKPLLNQVTTESLRCPTEMP